MKETSQATRTPPQWELGAPLSASGAVGVVYEGTDRRFANATPAKVVVRILEGGDDAPWRGPLSERAAQLASAAWPHVSPLLDAGPTAGGVYLVSPRHDVCAWSLLTQDCGLAPGQAIVVFEQMLEALATLHRRGLAHGDVRTRNVLLDQPKSDRPTAWLTDTAIGPLTWWSRSEFLVNDARRYYPPEWRGAPQEPSPEADVYALGLTACELLLGRDAMSARGEESGDAESLAAHLVMQLKAAGVAPVLRRLLAAMLADDPTQRVANADEAWTRWRTAAAPTRRGKMVLTALAAALVVGPAAWYLGYRGKPELRANLLSAADANQRQTEQLQAAQQQIAKLEDASRRQRRTIDEQAATLQARQSEIEDLAAQIAALEQTTVPTAIEPSPPPRAASPEAVAQQQWSQMLASLNRSSPAEQIEQVVRTALEHQPAEVGKTEYRSYFQRVRQFRSRGRLTAWMNEDPPLALLVERFLEKPWDDAALHAAESRRDSLEEATRLWAAWAEPQSNMTWEGMRLQIDAKAGLSDQTRQLLKGWYAAVEEQAARGWTLVLLEGQCDDGYDVDRIVRVYVDGKEAASPSLHAWDSPTAHRYDAEDDFRQVTFSWRPGQTFGLSLEQDGTLYNTNLVTVHSKAPFAGPLAIWQADQAGVTASKIGKLRFEIKANQGKRLTPIPGPPKEVVGGLPTTMRNLLDSSTP